MKKRMVFLLVAWCCIGVWIVPAWAVGVGPLIIDHRHTDVTQLTSAEIERAKAVLHIGYGHTSHGSQITSGMTGLIGFANGGGLGLSLPHDIFEWNNGGAGGALDLEEGAGYSSGWLERDCGYWTTWYDETREYLDDPSHADVNVIIWSWCGQMDNKFSSGTLTSEYLAPMAQLEADYTNVVFVYMTGHTEINDDADNKAACAAIRQWCIDNNKVLFDFNDIEHYDPDGTYYEFVDDDLRYFSTNSESAYLGNWGTEWQNAHTEGVDWYNSYAAHSQPVLANLKAYAAWKLWCELACDLDRDGFDDEWEERHGGTALYSNPDAHSDSDSFTDWQEFVADTDPTDSNDWFHISGLSSNTVHFDSSSNRYYSLLWSTNLIEGIWTPTESRMGLGGTDSMSGTNSVPIVFFKLEVQLP